MHCFKYKLRIGFHRIHYFLEYFDLKLFKIHPKNRHTNAQNTSKSSKAHIKKGLQNHQLLI